MQAGHNGGRVTTPNPYYESQAAKHGCHAMLAVGYSDPSKCFIVRNSWGENWVSLTLFFVGIPLFYDIIIKQIRISHRKYLGFYHTRETNVLYRHRKS
jgi:hypothetical protein